MNSKIIVGVVTNPPSPATDYYRGVGAFHYLDGYKFDDGRTVQINYIHPDELLRSGSTWFRLFANDMVIFQRPNGPITGLIEEAKRMGVRIISDIDDHLLYLPKGNPARVHFNKKQTQESVVRALRLSDHIIYSTDHLQSLYSGLAAGVPDTVIPNALNDHLLKRWGEWLPMVPQQSKPHFVYRGSATHLMDLFEVRSVFSDIRRSENTELTYFGFENPFDPSDSGYNNQDWIGSFFAYSEVLIRSRPDWMVVPLQVNDFNKCKSNIAWIEATWAGAAVLAPANLPEWDQDGVIHYDSPEHLAELVDQIASGKLNKEDHVLQSRLTIDKKFLLSRVNWSRLEVIEAMAGKREVA